MADESNENPTIAEESEQKARDSESPSQAIQDAIEALEHDRTQPWERDDVEIASDDSFPASDAPGWIH